MPREKQYFNEKKYMIRYYTIERDSSLDQSSLVYKYSR